MAEDVLLGSKSRVAQSSQCAVVARLVTVSRVYKLQGPSNKVHKFAERKGTKCDSGGRVECSTSVARSCEVDDGH